jgi:hypothetical protein
MQARHWQLAGRSLRFSPGLLVEPHSIVSIGSTQESHGR